MSEKKCVELVNESELELLIQYHPLDEQPRGFYFVSTDVEFPELRFFPVLCVTCQTREVDVNEDNDE